MKQLIIGWLIGTPTAVIVVIMYDIKGLWAYLTGVGLAGATVGLTFCMSYLFRKVTKL